MTIEKITDERVALAGGSRIDKTYPQPEHAHERPSMTKGRSHHPAGGMVSAP
jgi:hypothetical protein